MSSPTGPAPVPEPAAPPGYQTVTPWIISSDTARLIEFTEAAFGDRVGRVRDPLGNLWWIQAHVEDVDPGELARRPQDPAAASALRYVEISLDTAMREREA